MSEPRPTHSPSGAKLLNESKANPASVNMDIFAKKSARNGAATGQGTVNSNYLRETREQNPDPAQDQKEKPQVSLSNCKFATPVADLKLNEEFEFSVEVKKIGQPKSLQATFDLYATRKREGKEQRDKIWSGKEGKPVDAKAEPVVLKGKDVLATQADYVLGELVTFELEAIHSEAEQSAKSEKVEVSLKTVAHWLGGDDLFFRNDGEFPLLGAEGSLIGVLVAAVERFKKPGQDGETAICFGFASSAGEADANRSLSLRRAKAVKSLLDRDEAAWVELAKANFETVDIQQFLSDLHTACGWECDPGEVNGQAGPATKAAIESFQNECNARYNLGLKPDGVCGPKTWAAVHRAILGQVQAAMDEDATKAPAWPKPKWGNKGKGVHANGEDYATGGDKPEERSVQITFFAPGSEPPLKEVSAGQKASPEHNPVQQPDRVEKVKVEKGAGAGSGSKDDPNEDIIYDIASDSFAILDDKKIKILNKIEEFNKKLAPYRGIRLTQKHPKTGQIIEGDELVTWIWAINDVDAELSGKKDLAGIESIVSKIDEEMHRRRKKAESTLKSVRSQEGLKATLEPGFKIKDGGFKEYLRVGNRRAVWGFGALLGEDARWQPRDEVLRRIREERAKEKKEAKEQTGAEKELELKVFEKKLFEEGGSLIPSVENYFKDHCVNIGSGTKNLDLSVAATVFRGSAEAAYGVSVNWKDSKKVKVGVKAEASFALAQSSGTFTVSVPDKSGVDLIRILRDVDPRLVSSAAKALPIVFELQFKGSAFVGATASASLEAGIDLKQGQQINSPSALPPGKTPEGGLQAGCDLFAGAKASATVVIALKAKLLDDAQIKARKSPYEVDWTTVGEVSYGVWAAWGIGVTAGLKLGYFDKNWVFQGKLGVVLKGGCGSEIKGSLDVSAFMNLCINVCESIRWQGVGEIIHESALAAFEAVLFHCFVTGQKISQGAVELGKLKDEALRDLAHTASATMEEFRKADDFLDQNVPGYSGFKKYNATFLLLKATHSELRKHSLKLTKKEQAIFWVRRAEQMNTWMYATWKLKTNLIFDLSYGGSGWLGDFSEEDSEECIITVLKRSRSDWEFAKILQSLKGLKVDIDSCVDWAEQDKLDALKKQFSYVERP